MDENLIIEKSCHCLKTHAVGQQPRNGIHDVDRVIDVLRYSTVVTKLEKTYNFRNFRNCVEEGFRQAVHDLVV